MTTKLFVAFSVIMLALVGAATYRDQQSRDYLAIQTQYQQNHPHPDGSKFDAQVQQLFPSYADAKVGDTFRVERCISCHVPDLQQIGPESAARNLGVDFLKNNANAAQLIKDNNIPVDASGVPLHPAYVTIDSNCLPPAGSTSPTPPSAAPSSSASPSAASTTGTPASPSATSLPSASPSAGSTQAVANVSCANGIPAVSYTDYGVATAQTFIAPKGAPPFKEPGYLPASVNPSTYQNGQPAPGGKVGIDQIGCVVCHNGSRTSLSADDSANSPDRGAHTNLIVNPTYVWTKGASLYYQNCVTCHGEQGKGGIGPPLSNQDRLGFFNEDYYYRCIEYGMTGFEHNLSGVMPNWGSIAPDFDPAKHPDFAVKPKRVLSEADINTLVQFIRHWELYKTLP